MNHLIDQLYVTIENYSLLAFLAMYAALSLKVLSECSQVKLFNIYRATMYRLLGPQITK